MADSILNQISSQYGLPLPGIYLRQEATADSAYQQALANIAAQQGQTMASYGFKGDVGANGQLNNLAIDSSNPYSQVMSLLQNHAASMSNLRDQLISSGLGSTGLSAQRQNLLHFLDSGQTANLGQQFQGNMAGLYQQQGQALAAKNAGYDSAEMNALNYAIQNQMFNQAPAATNTSGDTTTNFGGDNKVPTNTSNIGQIAKTAIPRSPVGQSGLIDVPRLSNPIINNGISPTVSPAGSGGVRGGITNSNYQAAARAAR